MCVTPHRRGKAVRSNYAFGSVGCIEHFPNILFLLKSIQGLLFPVKFQNLLHLMNVLLEQFCRFFSVKKAWQQGEEMEHNQPPTNHSDKAQFQLKYAYGILNKLDPLSEKVWQLHNFRSLLRSICLLTVKTDFPCGFSMYLLFL